MSLIKKCPNCGAPQKRPATVERTHSGTRVYPTTYLCGSVDSPNWSPPIISHHCATNPTWKA